MLARKPNQSIMVGDEIEIKIIEVKGEQVKVGIAAPRTVSIHRKEIYEEIRESNLRASQSPSSLSQLEKISSKLKNKTQD